ncbi:MAG: helix-turn-helix domain-containing protein [Bacteroidota bacterium]
METIGEKITKIRKQKGLTQENLAENAKVNLRTIQRIENNETEPRGTTLNLICSALNVNIEEIFDHGKQDDSKYLMFFNLSVLTFWIIPIGNIIVPLILWQVKKDKIRSLHERAILLINFQIIWSMVLTLSVITALVLRIMHYYFSFNFFMYFVIIFYALNTIFPIVFAYRINKKIEPSNYPKLLSILK